MAMERFGGCVNKDLSFRIGPKLFEGDQQCREWVIAASFGQLVRINHVGFVG